MECSFSNYSSSITCAVNFNIKPSSQICYFHSCFDNIDTHLSQNRINPSSVCSELQLIKFRAGLFDKDTEQFTICPNHRYHLGKGWKPSTLCMLKAPLQICNGKRKTERATVTVQQSRVLREKFGILIPVGADKAKLEYVQQIDTKQSMLVKSSVNTSSECSTLTRGWALKSKRSVKRFTNEQTGFLKEMFEKGEMTGHKYDPEEVSVMMRTIKKDGKRRFSKDEFLTPSQISSFFSRLSREKRKTAQNKYQNEDFVAEEFENNLIDARNLVINLN